MTDLASLLAELVAIPSVNPREEHTPAETAVAEYVADWARRCGLKVHLDEVVDGRRNVVVVARGRRAEFILLETHLDTVEADGMVVDPYAVTERDGCLYGRGTCDAKGSLAVFMTAVERAVTDATLEYGVILAGVIDEEHQYRGVQAYRATYADRFPIIGAVVGEPTGLRAVTAHKGCVRCRIVATGPGGHSSEPEGRLNPIDVIADVIGFVNGPIRDRLPPSTDPLVGPPTIVCTMLEGGQGPNVLAERASVVVDRRTVPGEDPEAVWQDLHDQFALRFGDLVSVQRPFVIDYALGAQQDPFIEEFRAVLRKASMDDTLRGVGHGTDGSKLAIDRIPVVVFGPGSIEQAHTADEFVPVAELDTAAYIIESLITAGRGAG